MASLGKKSAKIELIELRNGGTPFEVLLAADFARGLSPRMLERKYDLHFTYIYAFAQAHNLKPPGRPKRQAEPVAVS